MSSDTTTKHKKNPELVEPTEPPRVFSKGITHLPGYDSLQERLSSPPSNQEPSKDTIFDLLRNPRRRYLLQYLDTHAGVVRLSDLADALAAWELEDKEGNFTYKERKRAYVSLYQTHLPKLDEEGIIEYSQPRGTIELGPNYQYLQEYLQDSYDDTLVWLRPYLSGGFVGVTIVGLAQFTVLPFVAISDGVWVALVLIVFGSILCTHWLLSQPNQC
jgi:hypothetical protein